MQCELSKSEPIRRSKLPGAIKQHITLEAQHGQLIFGACCFQRWLVRFQDCRWTKSCKVAVLALCVYIYIHTHAWVEANHTSLGSTWAIVSSSMHKWWLRVVAQLLLMQNPSQQLAWFCVVSTIPVSCSASNLGHQYSSVPLALSTWHCSVQSSGTFGWMARSFSTVLCVSRPGGEVAATSLLRILM